MHEINKRYVFFYSFYILLGAVNFGNFACELGYFIIQHRIERILKFVPFDPSTSFYVFTLTGFISGSTGSFVGGFFVCLKFDDRHVLVNERNSLGNTRKRGVGVKRRNGIGPKVFRTFEGICFCKLRARNH